MKVALSLLLLVAYANAGPIPSDAHKRPQSVLANTPTVIVGSSQVDAKSGGKITLHLDQRSQIGQETGSVVPVERGQPQPGVPIASVPKVEEEVRQPVPVPVEVVEPKQEPVLTGRNQVSPPKPVDSKQSEIPSVKTELSARNEIRQPSQVQQGASVVGPVVQSQVPEKAVPVGEKPLLVREEVPAQSVIVLPQVSVLPEVPVVRNIAEPVFVQPVVVAEQLPQTIIISEISQAVPVVPVQEPIRVVEPPLEVRSTQVQAGLPVQSQSSQPVLSGSIIPSQNSGEPSRDKKVQSRNSEAKEEKVDVRQKQVESQARNLKVDQTPVKAPVVVSSVQKQLPAVVVKSEGQQQQQVVVSQGAKLEGKHADVPVSKSESVAKPIQAQSVQVVPVQVEPARVVPVQVEPVRVVPVQVEPARVVPVQVEPARVESQSVDVKSLVGEQSQVVKAAVPEQSIRHEVPQVVTQIGKQVEPVVQQLSSVQSAVVPKSSVVIREDSVKPLREIVPVVQTGPAKPVLAQQEQSNIRVGQGLIESSKLDKSH